MGAADGRLSESFSRMIPGFCSAEIAAMCATSRFGGRATPIEPPQASRPSPHGHRRADHFQTFQQYLHGRDSGLEGNIVVIIIGEEKVVVIVIVVVIFEQGSIVQNYS